MGKQQICVRCLREVGRIQVSGKTEISKVWLGEIQSFVLKTQEIRRKVIEVTLK